ncbi:MAG: TerC/Alx family metal homeostasis membrane protein [Patescibacteria group bacterium]|nr:TerC/Alx family metal homeostasis membrane protein [Patescibacteria group bacterium]
MTVEAYLSFLFGGIIIVFLIADLGYFNRRAHSIAFKSALYQSLFWFAIALAFGFLIMLYLGKESAADFMSAYVTEKMLSVDNLFVFTLIFSFFRLEEKYHHRALFWGILGALVFRGVFIGAGALIISRFHWVLYLFGALLVYTGIKLLYEKKEEHANFHNNRVLRLAQKYLPFTTAHHGGRFAVRENGKFKFTLLFAIILLVETTDILFAVDSIPAVFAITQDPFLVFTSNIFAIMGLRALFFLIENVLHTFHHLQKGVSFVLVFIGLKMLAGMFGLHLSSLVSFAIIILTLGLSLLLSVLYPKKL